MPERSRTFLSWTPPVSDLKAWIAGAVAVGRAAAYWSVPSRGTAAAGVDTAFETTREGPARFSETRDALEAFWKASRWQTPGLAQIARAFSVFAFSAGSGTAVWHGLPRNWTWVPATLAVKQGRSLSGVAHAPAVSEAEAPIPGDPPASTTREHWEENIRSALESLAGGVVEKVVLARALTLTIDVRPIVAAVLTRLEERYPDCAVFCLGRNGVYFLGATPEPLIAHQGDTVRTLALAGTAASGSGKPRGGMPSGDALLADEKNLREHAFVARALRRALSPFCRELVMDERPGLLKAGSLLHLKTEFEGKLAAPVHLLDLAEALHPTPAVAGEPLVPSLEAIAQLEDFDRGWYAGPIGWIDPDGGGEFRVGLRSGVFGPGFCRLFAGCGVVEGSNAETEWWETDMKLHALASCLGERP